MSIREDRQVTAFIGSAGVSEPCRVARGIYIIIDTRTETALTIHLVVIFLFDFLASTLFSRARARRAHQCPVKADGIGGGQTGVYQGHFTSCARSQQRLSTGWTCDTLSQRGCLVPD